MSKVAVSLGIAAVLAVGGCASGRTGPVVVTGVGAAATARAEPLPTEGALAAVIRAARTTLRTRAVVEATVSLSGRGTIVEIGPLPRTIDITGAYDFLAKSGRLTVALAGGAIDPIREVFFPHTVYVSNLPTVGDGYWAIARRSTLRAHYVYRTAANDPGQALENVADAEEMAVVGRDTVNGARTIHYRGYLTTGTLTRYLSPSAQAAQQLVQFLGPQARRIEVWVTAAERIARLRLGFEARQGDEHVEESVQVDLSHFGTAVRVSRPAKRTSVAVPELSGVLLG